MNRKLNQEETMQMLELIRSGKGNIEIYEMDASSGSFAAFIHVDAYTIPQISNKKKTFRYI